jgi:hypothetical protein
MNLAGLKNIVTSKMGHQILVAQKHSPRILFGAGIVGVVATAVLASKATLKVEGVLDDHAKTLMTIKTVEHENYNDDDREKDTVVLYIQTAMKLTKLYAPAVTIGLLSIACLTGSHHIMSQRNAGLMAAYSALEKGFNKYRERVVADLGTDKDREYRYGTETREFVEETDEGPVVTREERIADIGDRSVYARLFGKETSASWNPHAEYNIMFLRAQQNYLNDKLRARGHVLLNDVYDALGLDRTKEGTVVGWVWGSKDGDNYIDFGIFDKEMQPQHFDFFTGRENAVWLDFNVDGLVYDKI